MQGWAMAVIVGEASWRLLHVMAPVTGVLMTTVALCRWLVLVFALYSWQYH